MAADAPRARRWLAWSRRLFGPLALAFLVAAAVASREAFAQTWERIQPGWLLGLVAAWASLHLLMPAFTRIVLGGLGFDFSYAESLRIHVSRLPARYLPGGIWHTVSRMVAFRERGVGPSALASLVVLENSVPLAVALLMGGLVAEAAGGALPGWPAAVAGALILVATPLVLRSGLFGLAPPPAMARLALAVVVFAVFWALAGLLFAAYWQAVPVSGKAPTLALAVSAYLLSWAAGFVAVFAPQGIGVFESVAGIMLGDGTGFAATAVLVAGFRAVTLAGDGLAWLGLQAFDAIGRGRRGR